MPVPKRRTFIESNLSLTWQRLNQFPVPGRDDYGIIARMVNLPVRPGKDFPAIVLISLLLVSLAFSFHGHIAMPGNLLADEGYMWYGAIRTAAGDIPLLDFASYDPGRYFWVASWFRLIGDDGVIAWRVADAAFVLLGLTFGLLTLRRVMPAYWMLALAGAVLLQWFGGINVAISLAATYFAMLLIEKPTILRHFGAGIFLGVAAFFGRNHGLYGLVAYFLLIVFIWYKLSRVDLPRRLAAWAAGIVIGYSPMIGMIVFIPGFFEAFWNDVMFTFDYGSTNLPLPVPWPWRIGYAALSPFDAVKLALTGTLFLLMPIFFLGAFIYLFRADANRLRQHAPFAAAAFVGAIYMHYAFSRADIWHLAAGIGPFLLAVMTLPLWRRSRLAESAAVLLLLVVSVSTVGSYSPYAHYVRAKNNFVKVKLGGDRILNDRDTARVIATVQEIDSKLVDPTEQLLIAPHWPGLYAILNRESPLWDTYFLFPASPEVQNQMIGELARKNTNWIIIGDVPLDGRDDLRFKSLYPLVWEHFQSDFHAVAFDGLPESHQLLRRNTSRR